MLGCERNFKENAELVATRCPRENLWVILSSHSYSVYPLWKCFCCLFFSLGSHDIFFTVFGWKSCILQNVWNTYALIHKHIHICVDICTQRDKKERVDVCYESKDNQLPWLMKWKQQKPILSSGLKKVFLQLLMFQMTVFCEWMSKSGRAIRNLNSYNKLPCVKTVEIEESSTWVEDSPWLLHYN